MELTEELKLQVKKKRTGIAPLRPPTLAPFLAWGGSAGAGRTRLMQSYRQFFGSQRNQHLFKELIKKDIKF